MNTPDKVFIIAAGSSLRGFDFSVLEGKGHTMAIKDSALHVKCDSIFNMDRLWIENRYKRIMDMGVPIYQRDCALRNIPPEVVEKFTLWKGDVLSTRMSTTPGQLNGDNAGHCALNLAFQWWPKEVYLLGFDFGSNGDDLYWYGWYDYHKTKKVSVSKYQNWGKQFQLASLQFRQKGIKVWNVNPKDTISEFDQLNFKTFKERLCQSQQSSL